MPIMRPSSMLAVAAAALVGVAQPLGCLAVNKARDLSSVSQSALKLWVTVDARVDVDGGRVAQWNDISHGENHAKQNSAGKPHSCPGPQLTDHHPREICLTPRVLTCRQEPCVREHPGCGRYDCVREQQRVSLDSARAALRDSGPRADGVHHVQGSCATAAAAVAAVAVAAMQHALLQN